METTAATNAANVISTKQHYDQNYALHLQHLLLKGMRPKTIEAYSRAIRRIGARFDYQIDDLTEAQLADFFSELLASHSWSAVKLDLYGIKFYTQHVLRKPWIAAGLIKPPKVQRLPDIVSVSEVKRIFEATRILSYRVFFFVLYSMGLRLGEGLRHFWQLHRNPVLLFPSRQGGVKRAARARTHLDPGGVQSALHKVVNACGLKKTSPRTACATAMQPT